MKLAFTTLGCHEWDVETIAARAREYGFDGVDFRGYRGEMDVWKLPEFSRRADETASRFADAGLEVPCFSSSAKLCAPGEHANQAVETEVRQYLGLCRTFGARFVRVFGGDFGDMPRERAVDLAAGRLQKLGAMAADHGVRILVETHDAWTAGADVRAIIEAADTPAAGVLWDIHHPYRASGEEPSQTWKALGPWIAYTHWKDATIDADGKHRLCIVGRGDLPLARFYQVLARGGYSGYATLEWERKWHPELAPAEEAFPAFVRDMRKLEAQEAKEQSE